MISLEQVYLLEEKVESAVAKIQQLQAENDALRRKCSELTNALSSKTEQLKTFSVDQTQIEEGIIKALDRLNQIENSVLKAAGQESSAKAEPTLSIHTTQVTPAPSVKEEINLSFNHENTAKSEEEKQIQNSFSADVNFATPVTEGLVKNVPDFNSMNSIQQAPVKSKTEIDLQSHFAQNNSPFGEEEPFAEDTPDEENSDDLGFDIF